MNWRNWRSGTCFVESKTCFVEREIPPPNNSSRVTNSAAVDDINVILIIAVIKVNLPNEIVNSNNKNCH
jgi:hypothetical protein